MPRWEVRIDSALRSKCKYSFHSVRHCERGLQRKEVTTEIKGAL